MQKKTTSPRRRKVLFTLKAPAAKEVCLAGNFNQWSGNKHRLKKNASGVWEKALMLTPGTYEYKYIVDGCWQEDPSNGLSAPNNFGTLNNLLTVKA